MSWKQDLAAIDTMVATYFDEDECRALANAEGLSPNHKAVEDPERPSFPFMGTIDLQPPSDIQRRYEPSDPAVPGRAVTYDAVLTAHVAAWPWMLKKLDRVSGAGETWRIEAIGRDGSNRVAFFLTRDRHARG